MQRTVVTLLAVVVALLLGTAAPARAHGADAKPEATDYRTAITAVTPSTDDVTVHVIENGARLELRSDTTQDVEVRGYSGEPYLKISADGVWTNTRSPATWINATADGKSPVPASARVDTAAAPQWQKVSSERVVRWHDHRSHWMSTSPPPAVTAAPASSHRLASWTVALVVAGTPTTVSGTLDYEPPPTPTLWWAAVVLAAAALFAVTYFWGRRPAARLLVAGALGVAALAELADAVGRTIVAGSTGFGVVTGVLTGQGVGLLVSLAALAAAVVTIRGTDAGPFALAFAGVCLALLGGLPDYETFAHAVPAVPWPGPVARLLTTALLGFSLGAALSGWWWLLQARRDARSAPAANGTTADDTTADDTTADDTTADGATAALEKTEAPRAH
ncbi:hypothetical protein [Cryptosporangium arvum]|uniref:Uncharacterized protein n=1 Tax=Cryptosporangium arvum DSM 44712 TaxID=927661 RepID=A0A011AE17_9ACTN|nr:hypothetical protein [Cryptosporangium arvum]EXG80261.1 hypothetical protein CryarDRAFT_1327 [Cryptosporangium arvum DSM 44712]